MEFSGVHFIHLYIDLTGAAAKNATIGPCVHELAVRSRQLHDSVAQLVRA